MTALTQAARRAIKSPNLGHVESIGMAASQVIYQGALVSRNSSGYAIPAADTATTAVIGIAEESVTSTAAAAGTFSIKVIRGVVAPFAIQSTSITVADIGYNAIVQDDNTVTDATTATNDIPVGVIVNVDSAGAHVCVGVFAPTNAP